MEITTTECLIFYNYYNCTMCINIEQSIVSYNLNLRIIFYVVFDLFLITVLVLLAMN